MLLLLIDSEFFVSQKTSWKANLFSFISGFFLFSRITLFSICVQRCRLTDSISNLLYCSKRKLVLFGGIISTLERFVKLVALNWWREIGKSSFCSSVFSAYIIFNWGHWCTLPTDWLYIHCNTSRKCLNKKHGSPSVKGDHPELGTCVGCCCCCCLNG